MRRVSDAPHDRTPVVVGVAQIVHREEDPSFARGPVDLMAEAVRAALADARVDSSISLDALWVVRSLSCRASNPALAVARASGVRARAHGLSDHGGDTSQRLVNDACSAIARGDAELIVVTGGEASRSRRRARAAGIEPSWFVDETPDAETPIALTEPIAMSSDLEIERGIRLPIEMYPIFETAIRAASGRTPEAHLEHVSRLWARFSSVAAANPNAWDREAHSAEEIRTPSSRNRLVGLPYTKWMNANNDVDMAAAVVVCSAGRARSLGVPRDRWVFPHAGVECHERLDVGERDSLAEAPAIAAGARLTLGLAGIGVDDLRFVDLYSCFPSAVQYGMAALGLGADHTPTVTGGLTFAGGPFNAYPMHAIVTVCELLRADPDEQAFVWANGGFATKHAFGVYSGRPTESGFRRASPQAELDARPRRRVARAGTGCVEGYTVMHERDGSPSAALAAVITNEGARTWGVSRDPGTLSEMRTGEWVGRAATVADDGALRFAEGS